MVSLVRGFSAIRTFKESSLRLTISNRARNYLIHNFALLTCSGLYNHSSPRCYNRFWIYLPRTRRAPAQREMTVFGCYIIWTWVLHQELLKIDFIVIITVTYQTATAKWDLHYLTCFLLRISYLILKYFWVVWFEYWSITSGAAI